MTSVYGEVHKATGGLGLIKSACEAGYQILAEKWENVTCPDCLNLKQELEWKAFVAKAHAKGQCEFSGMRLTECVRSICDCFETIEGAQDIERKAGLR